MKLKIRIYDDKTGKELEERELDLADIGEVSDAIDDVILRDGQSMTAADATADKTGKPLLERLFG